jgi:hypothetical protein
MTRVFQACDSYVTGAEYDNGLENHGNNSCVLAKALAE